MFRSRSRPLLLPAAGFLLGAALGPGTPAVAFGLSLILWLTTLAGLPWARQGLRQTLGCATAFLLGAMVCSHVARVPADSIERRALCADERPVLLRGRLRGLSRRTRGAGGPGVVADFEVESLRVGRIVLPLTGELRLAADADAAGIIERAGLIETWVRLRRWRAPRNFGRRIRPPGPTLARVTAYELIEVLDEQRSLVDRLRARVSRAIDGAARQGSRGLARALVLGVRDELEPELQARLRAGGTAHVLAVSGLHVALVSWAAAALARRLGASHRRQALVALGVAWSFAALAGFGLPVQRAAVLASCFCAGRLLGRGLDSWNALAAAVLITGLLRPAAIFGAGWCLTFGATAALILVTGPLSSCLPTPSRVASARLRDACAASAAAWLGLLPVQLYWFGTVNAAAALLNLVAVPVAALATAAALSGSALACMSEAAAGPLFAVVEGCAWALGLLDGSPWVLPGTATPAAALGWGAGLVAWAGLRDPRLRFSGLIAVALAGFALLRPSPVPWPEGCEARVTVLDIGQGSATLVELRRSDGPDWYALIDGGGRPGSPRDVGAELVVPALRALGLRRLDVVLLSHADYDHRGGLPAVVRAMRPELVLSAPVPLEQRGRLKALRLAAGEAGSRYGFTAAGARLGPDGRLEVLWPPRSPSRRERLDGNDASLVLRLAGARRGLALIPGDVEAAGEAGLLQQPLSLEAVMLVAPHHGSRTSSSPRFLAGAAFRTAAVSAGYRNRFGHPDAGVVERLRRPFVTAEEGAVRVSFGPRLASADCAGSERGSVLALEAPTTARQDPQR